VISIGLQLRLALRYLGGHKLRTALTTLGVILGVMIVSSGDSLLPTFMNAFQAGIMAAASKADLVITNRVGASFDQQAVETLRTLPGIDSAAGSIQRTLVLPEVDARALRLGGALPNISLSGLDPQAEQSIHSYPVKEGRFLQPSDGNAMVVSSQLARQADLHVGSQLRLPTSAGSSSFEVVGIVDEPAQIEGFHVFVPLRTAQEVFNLPGQVNEIDARFAPGVDPGKETSLALALLGDNFTTTRIESSASIFASLQIGMGAFTLFGGLALIMGGFIIFNTFRTVVTERRRDIGMLRALGATRNTVIGLLLIESLVQGMIGTAIGLVSGYLLDLAMMAIINPIMMEFIHTSLSRPVFTPGQIATSISLGVGVTVFAAILPAISAARVTPLQALRPEESGSSEQRQRSQAWLSLVFFAISAACLLSRDTVVLTLGVTLLVVALILATPFLIRPVARIFGGLIVYTALREGIVAQGNLQRQPGRAAITASATMIALALVVALTGVMVSIRSAFYSYIDQSLGSDYLILPQSLVLASGNVGAGSDLIERVRAVPGIRAATSVRVATAASRGSSIQVLGIDPVTYPVVSGLDFIDGNPTTAYTALNAGQSVIVNGIFAAQNHVQIGDSLPIMTGEGEKSFRVVAIGVDYTNVKLATVYLTQAEMAADFHVDDDRLILANRQPGADPRQTEAALNSLVAGYPAFTLVSGAAWRASQMQIFNSAIQLIVLFTLFMALPSLIAMMNTLAINVLERTREIGMLRAVGATRRQIAGMILAESLLLSILGAGIGILAGLALSYVLVQALAASGFAMAYAFPGLGIVFAIGVALVFGVLAAILPARQAAALKIVAALRYE
jgi:putative ABC transport system permease protein